ncbi:MAG TPA: ABC transporter ATP-binding protein, partial [Terriglobia bacterium]|nr:ABC transporter ATP-binding protein [Terriglobia bacterium]
DIIEQTLSAIPVVQAYATEERNERNFRAATAATLKAVLSSTRVQFRFKVLTGMATTLGTAAILWIGAEHVLEGTLTIGSILVFLSYLGSLYAPIESLMYTGSTIQGASGSAARVMEVMDTEPEVRERGGAIRLQRVHGHVRFKAVSFGYEPSRPVLHDISFEALPGETIAIVGSTGAGKSTLVSLLPRFYDPSGGSVTIDEYDLRDVTINSLRQQIAIVLQESFLFPISIAENIAYGRPNATIEEIMDAARAANAHQFIERLPEGYETMIGERGATLSGGERQRIAIARALLKNAPILILDEPTSALDTETEHMLLQALERLMQGRTTFIIAHRLSTIRNADRIVVLDNGHIIESGSHRELMQVDGRYRRLVSLNAANKATDYIRSVPGI